MGAEESSATLSESQPPLLQAGPLHFSLSFLWGKHCKCFQDTDEDTKRGETRLQGCTASHRDLNTDPRLGPPCPELQIISAAWRQGGPSEFRTFVNGFHKSHSYLILKPKQPSFCDKPACYLESHCKVRLRIPVWAGSKAWV